MSDFVCTIMARLEEVKGHDYIIEAAQILKSQGVTDLKILVAGTGGIEQRLKESAASRNVDDIVRFIGFVNDIPTLLSITDVQLNASYGTEATSMALLEGFSLSVPAVVSDFGGNPYVVINEDNGLIFPKKDSNALANAILKIKEDGNLYKKTSAGARAMFDMKFTAEKMTKNMQNIYYQLQGVK
jgi:glycosyltransferase involved in cell wall biosynthesis